jgi:hypothetical protein
MKVAVITGASQGIGAGLAAAFRRAGYAVVGTSRTIGPSDEPDFLTVQGDIAEPETAQRVVEQTLGRFGRIDTLVNNAGTFIGKPFTDYALDESALKRLPVREFREPARFSSRVVASASQVEPPTTGMDETRQRTHHAAGRQRYRLETMRWPVSAEGHRARARPGRTPWVVPSKVARRPTTNALAPNIMTLSPRRGIRLINADHRRESCS